MKQDRTHLVYVLLKLAAEVAVRAPHAVNATGNHGISTPFSTISQTDWAEGVRLWNEGGRHLITNLDKRFCPACGANEARPLFQSYDGYPFVECIPCGCWYVPLKVEAALFERFFAENPKAFEVLQRTLQGRSTETSHQSSLERIGAYLDALIPLLQSTGPLRYLDMGCGLGQSLQAAHARGLNAAGVESSRECIALATRAGFEVFHVSDQNLHRQEFDLISFWESLEHMVDPAAVLKDCLQMLAPNGLLAFSVPNQNSPLVRMQREDCSFVNGGYDTPGHINLFNPETIEQLLDRCGYRLLALDGQYGLDLTELVSYALGKQRGAYSMLRGRIMHNELSEDNNDLLRTIGPPIALLERLALATPILFGFACRREDAPHFGTPVSVYQERRREKLLAQIREMEPVSGDIALLQSQLTEARDRIVLLEDQLRVARNPLRRLVRFIRGKLKRPEG